MSGNLMFVSVLGAVVCLVGLGFWLYASVQITRISPKNADKIISAMARFPLRVWWRER